MVSKIMVVATCSLVLLCFAVSAFQPTASCIPLPIRTSTRSVRTRTAIHNSNKNDDDSVVFDMKELSRRIQTVAAADELEQSIGELEPSSPSSSSIVTLPTICFDALLPNQRLSGSTTDPVFGEFLRHVGLGGMFCMTSLNYRQRKLRRSGVLCSIEIMDAKGGSSDMPTAVDFSVIGRRACRLVGPSTAMVARVGRWRRVYDPDGEEARLGWGDERFVDVTTMTTNDSGSGKKITSSDTESDRPYTEWTMNEIVCSIQEDDSNEEDDDEAEALVTKIIPLLEQWQSLAVNERTYDNTDVVATARLIKGQPGLRVDPSKLLKQVLSDLGERPSQPTALALWGAALINPLPPLGVSPEIRGRILEAPNAKRRLEILEWAVKRSIGNLQGTSPL